MPGRQGVTARLYRSTPRNLAMLARALARGELVAVPSETVYGLAANALDPRACAGIFRAKRRPANDPLIVHIAAMEQLQQLAVVSPEARLVAAAFWPGPLTMVLPKASVVPEIVTSGTPSVAIRMPANRLFRKLITLSGCPLAAPSANPFGYVSPTSAQHVLDGLGTRIKYILDGGPSPIGLESTIIDLRDPLRPTVLRPGYISAAALSNVLGLVVAPALKTGRPDGAAVAPGLLSKHYSPRTKLTAVQTLPQPEATTLSPRDAFVYFRKPVAKAPANTFWLTRKGDLKEAARNLFALLRTLDTQRWKSIIIQFAPGDDPLAGAINDRIKRAAAKRT